MAIYLDDQLDDEPLYGIVARYVEATPQMSIRTVVHRLFGREQVASCMGGGLDYVARETQARWGLSPKQIAMTMSVFPYYAAISSVERGLLMLEKMCGLMPTRERRPRAMATSMAGLLGHRYCKTCLRDDLQSNDPVHWRRSHQLPGVIFCAGHGEMLWEFPRPPRSYSKPHFGYVSPCVATRLGAAPIRLHLTSLQKKSCQTVAQVSAELLDGRLLVDSSRLATDLDNAMRNASRYFAGSRYEDCLDRLLIECFGDDYLKMCGFKIGDVSLRVSLWHYTCRPICIVIAITLMRIVLEHPTLVADVRFSDLYEYLPQDKIQQRRRNKLWLTLS